ncbi:aldo-keto reductase AKR2E4-like [Nymphalis io]|uniref:aldo-keto reductase AKR2E4-like n=1 Tax=Inachis io TaxID=171585 RepID=UPI002168024C|nr:aldo-keto reductase AKR2E4-like [Nymphalis io]
MKTTARNVIRDHYIKMVSTADALQKTIQLNDGNRIPILSFGTFGKRQDIPRIKEAVIQAIEAGYRQIDTAHAYQNYEEIGEAIADVISRGIVKREDLWITTKVPFRVGDRHGVLPAILTSLLKLKLSYIDLYLIHSPENLFFLETHDYLDVWKGMEDVKKLNLTRSIGVSNFKSSHINRLLVHSNTVPSVNQIEVHPTYTDLELVSYCQSLNITVLSYAPFGFMVPRGFVYNPTKSTFKEPVLVRIANKYGKTSSQVVLRYLMDRGTIPIPRSTNAERIKLNIDIFDFRLTTEEINLINELNEGAKVYNFDPLSFFVMTIYFSLF